MKHHSLSATQRTGLFIGAIFSLIAAFVLLVQSGLPQRAEFIGDFIRDVGYVAPEINAIAPPFAQPTINGETIDLFDLRGESLVINFWATWCVPCRAEMPTLQAFHEDTGIRILAINMGESHEAATRWVHELGLTFDILLDRNEDVVAAYRLRGQPSTYVLAPDGVITHIFFGPMSENALRDALNTHESDEHHHD